MRKNTSDIEHRAEGVRMERTSSMLREGATEGRKRGSRSVSRPGLTRKMTDNSQQFESESLERGTEQAQSLAVLLLLFSFSFFERKESRS